MGELYPPPEPEVQWQFIPIMEKFMTFASNEIQRELVWLLDARYRLNPEEYRPAGACPNSAPQISVLGDQDMYGVTLSWGKVEATSTLSASEAEKILRQDSRHLIDRALHARFRNDSYIRRPLLIGQEMVGLIQGVLVTPLSSSKLCFEPLLIFPWKSHHEFCCANNAVIKDARRVNNMISAGILKVVSFPSGTLVTSSS